MAHRALTLKYRPQVFRDLIGQDHVTAVLARALEGGRVAHAFLFTGARGVGKTTSARILAKALNCERRGTGKNAGADPCNACTSCTEITSGVSLDVVEIDGASNRGIADVQSLREKVRFAPTGGKYRVVIIDEVHQLSNDAFAALLKTLEEPPPHLVFIFATTDPQKLPDTIRSRTQRFDFARVPLRKVADRLLSIQKQEKADAEGVHFELTDGAALLIAHKSEGSMRDAVSALDQVISAGEADVTEELVRRVLGIADRESFFTLAEAITGRDPQAALRALHAAFEKGLDARDLADGLAEHLRHVLVLKVDPNGGDLVAATAEDLARLRAQAERWSQEDLLRLLRIAAESSWPMRDSPQPLLHLEAAVLQMATLESSETFQQLLERLEALEKRLAGAPGPSAAAAPAPRVGSGVARSGGSSMSTAPATGAPMRPDVSSYTAPPARAVAPAAPAPSAPLRAHAAPAAGGAVAVAGDTLELDAAIETQWKAAIVAVNAKKRMLGAFLEESRFLGVTGHAIVLAMDDLHRAVVDVSEHRTLIREEVSRTFGRVLELKCAALTADMAPKASRPEDVKPMIDRAIAWFEGDILERPDRGGQR